MATYKQEALLPIQFAKEKAEKNPMSICII